MSTGNPLVEQVLAGDNPALVLLAAQGLLPLGPEDLVPLQVELAGSDDAKVAATAKESLDNLEPRVLLPYLEEDATPEVLGWYAVNTVKRDALDRIVRHRRVPAAVLAQVASRLPAELQESLLLRQDKIVEHPAILDALESNPELSRFSRRRIDEYRAHLVAAFELPEVPPPAADAPVHESDEEVVAAIEEVKGEPKEGEVDEETGLSEGQIRHLPVPVRLKLARGASKTLRSLLIRDNSAQVAVAVVKSNPLGDGEVEQYAKNRAVSEEVLEAIAKERRWVSKYKVCHALVCNPRTPTGISVRLVPRLSVRDLRNLSRDRNVSEPVRSTARRLYRVKSA